MNEQNSNFEYSTYKNQSLSISQASDLKVNPNQGQVEQEIILENSSESQQELTNKYGEIQPSKEQEYKKIITQLKTKNIRLTNNLKELNNRVNNYLKQQQVANKGKQQKPELSSRNSAMITSSEQQQQPQVDEITLTKKKLDNAYKLLSIYQKQNKSLLSKIAFDSPGCDKIAELESVIEQKDQTIQTLKKEINTINRVNQTQTLVLQSHNVEDQDNLTRVNSLLAELQQARMKVKELTAKLSQQEKNFRKQHEYLCNLELEYNELKSQSIQHLQPAKLGIDSSTQSSKRPTKLQILNKVKTTNCSPVNSNEAKRLLQNAQNQSAMTQRTQNTSKNISKMQMFEDEFDLEFSEENFMILKQKASFYKSQKIAQDKINQQSTNNFQKQIQQLQLELSITHQKIQEKDLQSQTARGTNFITQIRKKKYYNVPKLGNNISNSKNYNSNASNNIKCLNNFDNANTQNKIQIQDKNCNENVEVEDDQEEDQKIVTNIRDTFSKLRQLSANLKCTTQRQRQTSLSIHKAKQIVNSINGKKTLVSRSIDLKEVAQNQKRFLNSSEYVNSQNDDKIRKQNHTISNSQTRNAVNNNNFSINSNNSHTTNNKGSQNLGKASAFLKGSNDLSLKNKTENFSIQLNNQNKTKQQQQPQHLNTTRTSCDKEQGNDLFETKDIENKDIQINLKKEVNIQEVKESIQSNSRKDKVKLDPSNKSEEEEEYDLDFEELSKKPSSKDVAISNQNVILQTIQIGENFKESKDFDDKDIISIIPQTRIQKVIVYENQYGIAGIQVFYTFQSKLIPGNQMLYATNDKDLVKQELSIGTDDYLKNISAHFCVAGFITSITFTTNQGYKQQFGRTQNQNQNISVADRYLEEEKSLNIMGNYIPICLYSSLYDFQSNLSQQEDINSEKQFKQIYMINRLGVYIHQDYNEREEEDEFA